MQRLPPHDLCGYLQSIEPDEWEVLSLPCITSDGKALWPFKHSLEELRQLPAVNSFVFETQYMQNPQPAEGLMYREFKTYEAIPPCRGVRRMCYTDTADTGADYLCAICYEEHPDANYVVDVLYSKKPMEFTEQSLAQMLAKRKTQHCIVESNNGGRGFARAVQRLAPTTKVEWFHQSANKEARILSHSATARHLLRFPKGWQNRWHDMYSHLTTYRRTFQSNRWHDAADVITGIVERETRNSFRPKISFTK